MTALPNTRDALGSSWTSAGRHARRMAQTGRHAAQDIGSDMRELLAELEATLADGTQADAAVLREQLKQRVDAARARLEGTRETLRARAATALSGADHYVHENPWGMLAVVGGFALVAGWLMAARSR